MSKDKSLFFGLQFLYLWNEGIGPRCKLGFFYLQIVGCPKLCLSHKFPEWWELESHILGVTSDPRLLHQINPDGGFWKHPQWFCQLAKTEKHCRRESLGPLPALAAGAWLTLDLSNLLLRKTREKICHHDPEDERARKRPLGQPQMQKQRWLHPRHRAEALGIGLPRWSTGHDRENDPGGCHDQPFSSDHPSGSSSA